MRATRPSIMSLGATTSAPARACTSAICGEHLERGVVVDLHARRRAASAGCRSGRGPCTRRRTRPSSRRARARRSSSRPPRGARARRDRGRSSRARPSSFGSPKRMTPPRPRASRLPRDSRRVLHRAAATTPGIVPMGRGRVDGGVEEERARRAGAARAWSRERARGAPGWRGVVGDERSERTSCDGPGIARPFRPGAHCGRSGQALSGGRLRTCRASRPESS